METNLHVDPEVSIISTSNIFLPLFKDIFLKEGLSEEKKRDVFYSSQEKTKKALEMLNEKFYQKNYDPNNFFVNVVLLDAFNLYPKPTIDKIKEIRRLRNILEHDPIKRKEYTRFELERYALEYSDFIYDFSFDYYKKYIFPQEFDPEPVKNVDCVLINERKSVDLSTSDDLSDSLSSDDLSVSIASIASDDLSISRDLNTLNLSKCDNFYYCEYKDYVNKLIRNINSFNDFKEEFDLRDINTPNDLDKSIEYLKIFLNKPKYVKNETHLMASIRNIDSFQKIQSGNIEKDFYEFSLIKEEFIDLADNKLIEYHLKRFKGLIGDLKALFNEISFFYKCQTLSDLRALEIYLDNLELLESNPKYIADTDEVKLLLEIIKDMKEGNSIYEYNIIEIREAVNKFDKKLDEALIKREIFRDHEFDPMVKSYEESAKFLDSPLAKRLNGIHGLKSKLDFMKNKLNKLLKNKEYNEIDAIFASIFGKGYEVSDVEMVLDRIKSCKDDVANFKRIIKKYAKYDMDSEVLIQEAIRINNYNNGYTYYSKILNNLDVSEIKLAKYRNWEESSKILEEIFGNLYSGFNSDLILLERQFDINKKYSDLVKMGFFKENITDYIDREKLIGHISKLKYYKEEVNYQIQDIDKNLHVVGTVFSKENVYTVDFDDLIFVIYKALHNYDLICKLDLKDVLLKDEDKYSEYYYETLISNLKKNILDIDRMLSLLDLDYMGLFIKLLNSTKANLIGIKGRFMSFIESTNIKEKIENDVIARRFFEDKWNATHSNTNELRRYLERSKSFTEMVDNGTFSKRTEESIHKYTVENLMDKLNNLSRLKKVFKEDTFIEFLLNTSSDRIDKTDFNVIKEALEEFNNACLDINK